MIAVATFAVAAVAVVLLGPGYPDPQPVNVAAERYFDQAALQRAVEFRDGQRSLAIASIALGLAAALALGRLAPRRLRGRGRRLAERPVVAGALAGAAFLLLLALVALPLAAIAHQRSLDIGLSTQGFGPWLLDRFKGAGLTGLGGLLAGAALVWLQRRFGLRWWLPGSALALAFAILITWIGPSLIEPLFADFTELERGPVRDQVLDLADRAGVEVDEVDVIDASQRSTALNAYVSGIGTRRVVLYDNLIDALEGKALRSVVAHELGHVAAHDVRRGLMFVAIVAPLAMLLVSELGRALAAGRADAGRASAVPAYLAALTLVSFALGIVGNSLSRQVEAQADQFSLRLTDDPGGLIELQRELATRNLSDPDPPAWSQALFATHPTTLERIGAALSFERHRATPPDQ